MAFITDATRKVVIDHAVATLGRAPSAAELAAITKLLNNNASLADVADYLTSSEGYLAKYPLGQTAKEVAADILDAAIVGGVLAADFRLVAIDLISGGLTAGTYTIASATNAVVAYLSNTANNDNADFGDIAKAFQNRTAAAEEFTTTFTLEGVTVTEADLAAAVEGVTSDAATLTAAKAAFEAGSKSIAEQAAADKVAADAAAAKAAEEKAAADKAAADKAAADKAAADAAAAEQALVDAATEAAATAATAIEATEEADAAVTAAQTASDEAAATAAETDAEALATALETATTNDTDAKAALETASEAYDAAIAAGVAADVVTANGNKLIAQDKADKAAAALVEATTASEEATAADAAAATAATALTDAIAESAAAADAADAAAAAAVEAAAATADEADDEAAAAQVVAAAAANPVGDAAAEAAAEKAAEEKAAADKAAEEKAAADQAAADKAAADKAAADAAAAADALKEKFAFTTGQDNETLGAYDDSASASLVANGATGTTAQPGDTLDGGAGTDKLTLSVSGDSGGAYTLQALITDSVETLHVNNFETDAANGGGPRNTVTTIDSSLMVGLEEVGLSASSAEGDTKFDNVMNIVDVAVQNGAGDLEVTYASGVTTGTQTQNIALSNVSAGTLKIAGVENLNISSGLVKSTLTALTAAAMKSITVTGSTDLEITGALDFADDATGVAGVIDGTVDASEFTGKLTVTSAADEVSITGGSGNDTINMAATFDGYDKIDGGDGTDTLTMDAAALSTQFAQTSNIENVVINNSTAAVGIDASKLSAGVDMLTLDLTDGTDATPGKIASTVTKADGLLINLVKTVEDAADTNDSDGTKLTITNTTDTTDDTVNIRLTNIGVDDQTADFFGIDEIDVSTYETVNITANTNAKGTASANEIEALTATVATSINVSGTGALETVLTGTKVTSFDASELAGALTLTAGSEKATYSMGGKSSTIAFGGNLNASDTVIGGAGTADIVTATVTGLTATTGALNTSDVEYVLLTTSGANTLDLSGTTGLSNLAVTDNKQTITGLDLATTTVHLGLAADASATASEIDVTAADATGTDDTLKVIVNTTAGAATSIIDASAIENLSLTVGRSTTGTNATTTLDMTTFEGSKVTVGTAALAAGATVTAGTVDLGTLHKNTTTLVSTNKAAVTASMTNATAVVTYEGLGTGIQTITGGLRGDTFTIGSTAAIAHVIDGGAGTDTTNLTAATNLADVSTIDTENVNITVPASVDVAITGDFNAGVDVVTITGGNSLSTFDAGTINTAIKTIDASEFLGNLLVDFAASDFDATVSIKAGELTTDEVTAVLTTDGTYVPATTGVEILDLDTNGTVTVDLSGTTGVSSVQIDLSTAAKTATVSNVVNEVVLLSGSANANNILEAKPVDSTAADNAITFQLKDDATITADTKLKTTDVETVTVKSSTTESIDLSLLSMTLATGTLTLNLVGDATAPATVTLSATSAQTTTINASLSYGVTQNARSATTAVDYTGSAGSDTFIMMNAADKIAAGAGTGDTLDVDYAAVLGGISVDLSSTGEQISTLDGGAISGSVTGFESVDLSGYTGFGASVTAIKTGSTITGTSSTDRITGGAGADTVVVVTATSADADVVVGGSGSDTIKIADGLAGTTTSQNVVDLTTPGNGAIANTGAFANYSGFENIDVSAETGATDGFTLKGDGNANVIKGSAGDDIYTVTAGNDTVTLGAAVDNISITTALLVANSGTTATIDGGTGTDVMTITDAGITVDDADFRGITLVETLTLASGTNAIALGANAKAAGIITVNGASTGPDTITVTKAFAETTSLAIALGTTGTDTIIVSDSGAVDFSGATIATADALTVAADAGADAVKIAQAFFDTGAGTSAATLTITGAADADDDTLEIVAGTTAWDVAGAEAASTDVNAAGEYFLGSSAGDGVLTYYNEAGATVVTLTIVGLDGGAIALSGGNLLFTA